MIVNHALQFVFYHVPKTAGSSVRAALMKLPGCIRPHGSKHLTPADAAGIMPEVLGYFSFCFVRDPWERFGSLHRFLAAREHTADRTPADINAFAEQLERRDPWLMGRHSIIPQHVFADGCTFVGRYERLEEDALAIAQRFGKQRVKLKPLNRHGEPVRYRDGMSSRTQAIIAEHFQRDIEQFGYR